MRRKRRGWLRASTTWYQRAFKVGYQIGGLVRWRRDDSDQTRACARSPARHGAERAVGVRSPVVVGRRSPGVVWSRHVVVCGRRGPSQRTPAAVKHFAMRIISTNPPFCVSSYEATCILSVVSTCIPDGGTCMSSFAKVRSGERGGGGFIRIQGYYRGTQGACG